MAYIMSSKEDSELSIIRKASQVSVDIFNKYLKDQVMEIIDSDKVRNSIQNNSLLIYMKL